MSTTDLAPASVASRSAPAQIGPNAISRMAEAMTELHGRAAGEALFVASGMSHHWTQPPQVMVDEQDVMRLHHAARRRLGIEDYRRVARLAGDLTGRYVREHRIPRAAQLVIRSLPRSMGMLALSHAIRRHAWTFVGSGSLRFKRDGRIMRLFIEDSPLARGVRSEAPICDYYTASFERLFQDLVGSGLSVQETECSASGAHHCVFVIS